MNLSVIDACFPLSKQSCGMAALWLRWYIPRCGGTVTDPQDADALLVTCVDPRNWTVLKAVRKRYPGRRVFAGGAGALAPYSLGLHCDAVCVGNGERFVATVCKDGAEAAMSLPESWVDGQARAVEARELRRIGEEVMAPHALLPLPDLRQQVPIVRQE